jgi:hypothetical protein
MALQYSAAGGRALVQAPLSAAHDRGLIMRFEAFALACLGAGALVLAAADPPSATQSEHPATAAAPDSAAPATSATTAAPAAPIAPSPSAKQPAAPTAAAPALSPDEQRLLNEGYKPQMRNGQKVYCRREAELGSRIADVQHCGSVTQLKDTAQNGRDYVEKAQRSQFNPTGK